MPLQKVTVVAHGKVKIPHLFLQDIDTRTPDPLLTKQVRRFLKDY